MDTRDLLHFVVYEMKVQSRTWVFRLFVLFSLVGVVASHVYWQGQGNCVNWKMVALPCSMPLVNAYLFSVVQSLFLVVMMADVPRRLARAGALDGVRVRPYGNTVCLWGVISGNFILFLLVNLLVVICSIFLVNSSSLAEIGWRYYLFYLLTLNVPSWVFVVGMTLGISSISGFRFPAIAIVVIWLTGCIFWLPYHFHGTFDFLASGVPNLFSGIVGHVNLSGFLLHRSAYLLLGFGGLMWGVRGVKRLPNRVRVRGVYTRVGLLLLVAGVGCGFLLEFFYFQDRAVREFYRESFSRYWKEETCRVRRHSITLEQSGERITVCSDMVIHNPGERRLDRIILFLNPGLRVTGVSSGKDDLIYRQDGQVIVIERCLEASDSLLLNLAYGGKIDDRFCDLHLSDRVFEDSFRGDSFFPTGRKGVFTREDLLLLTPACTWYPVAIPPVNPAMPLVTGRDFTLFRLFVKHPLQKMLFSQGNSYRTPEGEGFVCGKPLHGISLHGSNLERYVFRAGEDYGLQFGLTKWGGAFARRFSGVDRSSMISLWREMRWFEWSRFKTMSRRRWFEPGSPWLYLAEVPVSFHLDSHGGKPEAGLVEPGAVFFPERGFEMNLAGVMGVRKIKNGEDLLAVCSALYRGWFAYTEDLPESHPLLGMGKIRMRMNENAGESLWDEQNVWVHSSENPFVGEVFSRLQRDKVFLQTNQGVVAALSFSRLKEKYDYLSGHALQEILSNGEIDEATRSELLGEKMLDLWMRLTLNIPGQELRGALDSLGMNSVGRVDYKVLSREWSKRWKVNVDSIISEWITTRHEQYFKVRDAVVYSDPRTRDSKAEGMILNAGKSGGVVSIEYGTLVDVRRFGCYLKAGEAKAFTFVLKNERSGRRGPGMPGSILNLQLGLAANRPTIYPMEHVRREQGEEVWEPGGEWRTITMDEFTRGEDKREIVVDDQSAGFSWTDGNLTWFQRWNQKAPRYRDLVGEEATRWCPVITLEAYGDSIRSFYCIRGGTGRSTATWRTTLPEAGRYRVLGKVYRESFLPGGSGGPGGVVYYYMIRREGVEVEVEINLDALLPGLYSSSCWASLGEFDFPAGEVSVTLSDKEVHKRKDVAIIADAVKFIKLE